MLGVETRKRTSTDWADLLTRAGVPCGPIYSIDQTFNDPQVKHLGIARTVEHASLGTLGVVGQPINLSAAPQPRTLRLPTPELGEHSEELLGMLGYDEAAIARLTQSGTVRFQSISSPSSSRRRTPRRLVGARS